MALSIAGSANVSRPSHIVILGSGSAGMQHAAAFTSIAGTEVTVVPVRSSRVDELRAAGLRAIASIGQIREPIDGIVIATNTDRHLADVTAALRAGHKVMVEKPGVATLADLNDLFALQSDRASDVFVAYNLRFDLGIQYFRSRLSEIGDVYAVEIVCRSFLPDWRPNSDYRASYSANAESGGVLRDLSHELDYAAWLFGAPEQLWCEIRRTGLLDIASDDQAILHWRTSQGASVAIALDYLSRSRRRTMTAYGSRGVLCWDGVQQVVTLTLAGMPMQEYRYETRQSDRFVAQANEFLSSLDNSDPGLLTTLADERVVKTIDAAARRSSETGGLERLTW